MDIGDGAATDTTDMMVTPDIGIEAGFCFRAVDLPGYAQADEGIEDPVDRCPGNSRKTLSDTFKHLIGCRMVISPGEFLNDTPALDSQG